MSRQKSKKTRQKNERGDRKEESNDSPEIPDKGRLGHQTSPASFRSSSRGKDANT